MYIYLNWCCHLQSAFSGFIYIYVYLSTFWPCMTTSFIFTLLYFHPVIQTFTTKMHSNHNFHCPMHTENIPPSPACFKVTSISSKTDYSLYQVTELLVDDSQETISCLEACLPISSCNWVMWDFFPAIETIRLLQFVWFQLTIIAAISTADLAYVWSWCTIKVSYMCSCSPCVKKLERESVCICVRVCVYINICHVAVFYLLMSLEEFTPPNATKPLNCSCSDNHSGSCFWGD